MREPVTPPRLGRWLLTLCRLGPRRQEVAADLLDLFVVRCATRGRGIATWRYLTDVMSLWTCRPERSDRSRHHGNALAGTTRDLVFATRLFRRHPALFSITVAGLAIAVGITTSVVSVVRSVAFAGYGAAEQASVYRVALTSSVFAAHWAPLTPGC